MTGRRGMSAKNIGVEAPICRGAAAPKARPLANPKSAEYRLVMSRGPRRQLKDPLQGRIMGTGWMGLCFSGLRRTRYLDSNTWPR